MQHWGKLKMALTDKLEAIANAIRTKTGSAELLTLEEMPVAIISIEGGGSGDSNGKLGEAAAGTITTVTEADLAGVTQLRAEAFSTCELLTSVYMGDNIQRIGGHAFANCDELESIRLSENITSIADSTFLDCKKLASIVIPDGVTSLGMYAFAYCSNLGSITLGTNITTINASAFDRCSKLTDVYYKGTEAQWNAISIKSGNDSLTNATIHYNS